MAFLKQRLETLLGHEVQVEEDASAREGYAQGVLVEAGEDYVGIEYNYGFPNKRLELVPMARVIHILHDTTNCPGCLNPPARP